jgi:hypothetical protein
MTREPAKNSAASIRARLLAQAQSRNQDYQRVLGRYAIERFLYRLGRSPYRSKFAIKGATLFTLWTGETHRPTKDLDMLGCGCGKFGNNSPAEMPKRGDEALQDGKSYTASRFTGFWAELAVILKNEGHLPTSGIGLLLLGQIG